MKSTKEKCPCMSLSKGNLKNLDLSSTQHSNSIQPLFSLLPKNKQITTIIRTKIRPDLDLAFLSLSSFSNLQESILALSFWTSPFLQLYQLILISTTAVIKKVAVYIRQVQRGQARRYNLEIFSI